MPDDQLYILRRSYYDISMMEMIRWSIIWHLKGQAILLAPSEKAGLAY